MEYDENIFKQLNELINQLFDANTTTKQRINRQNTINKQLNAIKNELINKSSITQTDNDKLNKLYQSAHQINQRLNINHNINTSLNEKLNENYQTISNGYQKDRDELYDLINKKQQLIQALDNLTIIKNIINTNITYDDSFNLDANIKLSPAYNIIKDSGLFDEEYYINNYLNDENLSEHDAIEHYLLIGSSHGNNPNENFNNNWYKVTYLLNENVNPLLDYILKGQDENRQTQPIHEQLGFSTINSQEYTLIEESGYFNRKWYRKTYNINTDEIEHFLNIGSKNNYNPNPDFDTEYYTQQYNITNENPLIHYILNSQDNQINSNMDYHKNTLPPISHTYPYIFIKEYDLLDMERYNKYQDKGFYTDEIANYVELGYKKGYFLNLEFDKDNYKQNDSNPFEDPLDNYIYHKAQREYKISNIDYTHEIKSTVTDSIEYNVIKEEGLFDETYYKRTYKLTDDIDYLAHYIELGDKLGYNPSKNFNTIEYQNKHDLDKTNSLYHYILNVKKELFTDTECDDLLQTQEYTLIEESGLFDTTYYTTKYAEDLDEYTNPIIHYMTKGNILGYNPSSEFNTEYYHNENPQISNLNMNPLVYYILYGMDNHDRTNDEKSFINTDLDEKYLEDYTILSHSKYFDAVYYTQHNPNIGDFDDAIDYYLKKGRYEDYPTSKYFDKKEYYRLNLDLKTYGVDPVIHFTNAGYKEKRPFKRARLELSDFAIFDEKIRDYYNVIYDSDYFDEYYYMENNPEVEALDIDPILHYILVGADEGKNPSKFFSTNEYLRVYGDVKNNGINPLYHYLNNGIHEGRHCFIPKEDYVINYESKYDLLKSKKIFDKLHNKVSIIIPIYNAYEQTRECLTSVLENTRLDYELILINDCSSDERIDTLLDSLKDVPFIKVINNETNQGFVKNVNKGMKISKHDVVLLNSDTKVTPRWLSKILISAYSDDKIGTVTPISNSSDIAIPQLGLNSNQQALNNMSYQVDKLSINSMLESPTGNGFCLFIKRDLIEDIGYFDEIFGMGYGEETDFTSRALQHGWKNIRNTSVFVYHERHASFKKENTDKLKAKNKKIIEERYPNVFKRWDNFSQSLPLQKELNHIQDNIIEGQNLQRVLCITEIIDSEPDIDNLMLLRLSRRYDTYVLAVDDITLKLFKYTPDMSPLLNLWEYDFSWDSDKFFNLYFNILVNLKIDLIYLKDARRLYHSSNNEVLIYNKIINYLEIQQIAQARHDIDTILPACDRLLSPVQPLDELVERYSSNIDFKDKKLVIYTAVTGTYDEPIIPQTVCEDADYICFTDNPFLKSDFWDIRQIPENDFDAIRTARMYKILPHKFLDEYDYSLWIDTNVEIIGDVEDFINKYSVNNKLLSFNHPQRDCLYEEMDVCVKSNKDTLDNIVGQLNKYRKEHYPEHNGLVFSAILFRDHHDGEVIKVMEDWFDELTKGSFRDQLSFNYVTWKNNFQYDTTDVYIFKNEYFQMHDHLSKGYFMRKINTPYDSWYHLKYNIEDVNRITEALKKTTSIVIPIYNAYEETKECIESVLKNTTIDYELLLINDCSSDERIYPLLESYRDYPNIRIIHNKTNNGFVKNVNKAFMQTSGDVVLLNSDTIVTPKWLQRLKFKAYSNEKIATVTPVSNNAGAFSVPQHGANDIPNQFTINDMANIVEKASDDSIVLTPTANGFCMYIKKEAIYSVGFFDEIYGMGYGEENDFSMRLLKKGWKHIIDPSVYIYHKRSASFSDKKAELIKKHSQILRTKFPDYKKRVNEFLSSTNFSNIRKSIDDAINSTTSGSNRKRILYAIHNGSGGALHTTMDIMKNVDKSMDTYLLVTGKRDIALYKYNSLGNNDFEHKDGDKEFVKYLQLLRKWPKTYTYSALDTSIDELKMIYFNILVNLKIDIVHIMHLIHSSFDLPILAKQLGIPVILSFHDFYYVCPSHNLLDDNSNFCGGQCTPYNPDNQNNGQCSMASGLNLPILKLYKNKWQEKIEKLIDICDAFQAPSQYVCDLYKKIYPQLENKDFRFIEHGRDLTIPENIKSNPIMPDKPVKILFPGHIGKSKGYELIKQIKQLDTENKLEFHYMGSIFGSEDLEEYGTYHGFYDRSDFDKIVEKVNPHFIGILSIWPETYCHTLTEAWSTGKPVITVNLGALRERVKRCGGGYFIDLDAKKAYHEILDIINNENKYNQTINEISQIKMRTTHEMTDDYIQMYKKYIK